jgi:putative heme-binding domain-containing protein
VLGGIYRVRRADAADATAAADHRGHRIAWSALNAADLAELLADPRPAVVKRATEGLAQLGPAAIGPVASLLSAADRDARQAALWTLARLDDDASRAAARRGLVDPDPVVRHAAAHVAAIFRDEDAVSMLAEIIIRDEAGVARAAAEALGRIGGEQGVAALLAACPRASDRSLEHSVTYGLIEAGRPTQVWAALDAESPRVRRAALVAIDQMPLRHPHLAAPDPGRLRREILAACRDDDAALRDAGFWLLSEHPAWADGLADGITKILARVAEARLATPPRRDEADRLTNRLSRIAVAPVIAAGLAAACAPGGPADPGQGSVAVRLAALDVMEGAGAKPVPDAWVDALGRLLRQNDSFLGRVLRTLAGMSLSAEQRRQLQPALLAIAAEPSQSPAAVTLALRAAGPEADLPEAVVDRLIAMLAIPAADSADTISPLERSAAAAAIATADLSIADLEAVAATFTGLPSSDVATLLPVITARGGLPLVYAISALARSPSPDRIPRELLAAAVVALPAEEASRGPALLARVDAARVTERAAYTRLLARLPTGDPMRGHAVFLSQKAACTTCHAMGYAGGRVGPDLTKIGGVRTPHDLLEAIVLPSASFVRSYEPVMVLTDDGRSFAGVIREETAAEVTLQTNATTTERIARDRIESLQAGTVSLMPKGYETLLTPQELADLVAFLAQAK